MKSPCLAAWEAAGRPEPRDLWEHAWDAALFHYALTSAPRPSLLAKRDAQIAAAADDSRRALARWFPATPCAYCDEPATGSEQDGPDISPVCDTHTRRSA